MATVEDVVQAWEDRNRADGRYREVLRAALAERGTQARLVTEMGRSREQLRQDAMTDEERAAVREADAERKRRLRERAATV